MVKLFLVSIIENIGVENFWDNVLGKQVSLTFGQECASAAIWMFFVLILRSLLHLLGVLQYLPLGFSFSFPLLIHVLSKFVPFMQESAPLLSVRVVECILGRVSSRNFLVVFPAHFLGCIVGAVFYQFFCPSSALEAFDPVYYPQSVVWGLCQEILSVSLFSLAYVVVPEILSLNQFRKSWLSLFAVPLYFLFPIDQCPTFNPAALYALWYVRMVSTGSINYQDTALIQIEHILGPVIGGVIAGIVCLRYFPDDPLSWKPKR